MVHYFVDKKYGIFKLKLIYDKVCINILFKLLIFNGASRYRNYFVLGLFLFVSFCDFQLFLKNYSITFFLNCRSSF